MRQFGWGFERFGVLNQAKCTPKDSRRNRNPLNPHATPMSTLSSLSSASPLLWALSGAPSSLSYAPYAPTPRHLPLHTLLL